jgi:hypothetical protein
MSRSCGPATLRNSWGWFILERLPLWERVRVGGASSGGREGTGTRDVGGRNPGDSKGWGALRQHIAHSKSNAPVGGGIQAMNKDAIFCLLITTIPLRIPVSFPFGFAAPWSDSWQAGPRLDDACNTDLSTITPLLAGFFRQRHPRNTIPRLPKVFLSAWRKSGCLLTFSP